MKKYALTSTACLLGGWLIAMMLFSTLIYYLPNSTVRKESGIDYQELIFLWFWSFIFLMIANLLFIQWPKSLIIRLCSNTSKLVFVLLSGIYAITVFTLLIGRVLLPQMDAYLMFTSCAMMTGLIFGLTFYTAYRRSIKWTTSTTPS